mgnify:CR=1 FL=1
MAETKVNPKTTAKSKARRQTSQKAGARTAQARKIAPEAAVTAFEQFSSLITDLARTNFEETVETARAVFGAKDVNAAVEIQNDYMRSALTRNLEAARDLNALATNAVRETAEPYAARMTEAFDKIRAA